MPAANAEAADLELRGNILRRHLDRLIEELDDSTLRATLQLMIAEARGAVSRQEGLIALERLEGRDTSPRMDRLRELRSVQKDVMAVYAGQTEAQDEPSPEGCAGRAWPQRDAGGMAPLGGTSAATASKPSAFVRLAAVGSQEQQVYGGRIPFPLSPACRACPDGSAPGNRQGRDGARAAG